MPLNAQVSPSSTNPEFHVVVLTDSLDETVKEDLESTLARALQDSPAGILLDMAGVEFVSSAGLGVFTTIRAQAQAAAKQIVLCSIQPAVYKTLKLCIFDQLFPIYDDQPTAVKAMAKAT